MIPTLVSQSLKGSDENSGPLSERRYSGFPRLRSSGYTKVKSNTRRPTHDRIQRGAAVRMLELPSDRQLRVSQNKKREQLFLFFTLFFPTHSKLNLKVHKVIDLLIL